MSTSTNANVIAARVEFEALVDSALSRAGADSLYQRVVREKTGLTGDNYTWVIPGGSPIIEDWEGSQEWSGYRTLAKAFPIKTKSAGLEIPRVKVDYDRDGSVAEEMRVFLQRTEYFKDKLTFETLANNPDGADGVSLINSAHPYGPGGATWSNDVAAALSFASYDIAQTMLRNRRDERGVSLNLRGDTLVVNPQQRRIANEIASSTVRPTAVSSAGVYDGTSNIVGAGAVDNVLRAEVAVIETTYMAEGSWALIDSRYPPLGMPNWRDITPVILDRLTDHARANEDVYQYKLECDITVDGLEPWGLAGRFV